MEAFRCPSVQHPSVSLGFLSYQFFFFKFRVSAVFGKNLSPACHMNLKGCTLQSLTASRTASCSFIAPGSFRASIPQLCYKNTRIQRCRHEGFFFQKCSQTQQLGSFDCQEAQNSGLTYPFLVLCQRPKQASSSKDLLGKINGLLLFCFQKVQEKVQDRTSHKGPFQHF